MSDFAAIVLAGGKSQRMGRPKALLEFGGEPCIVHLVRRLGRLLGEVIVVAAPEQELPRLPALVVRDERAYQGPVGGIYYGLCASNAAASFVTSCDVPFLRLSLVSHLIGRIQDHDVVVPEWEGRLQPLHAVYRRSVLPLLKEQLDEGRLRPVFLFEKVRTHRVSEDEVRAVDPEGQSFLNMNTPKDYEEAAARWSAASAEAETIPARGHCEVELFGVARLRAGTDRVVLDVHGVTTLEVLLMRLADRLPTLVGPVLAPGGGSLAAGNACNVNGREFVTDPKFVVRPGDHVLLVSSDAGG